MEMTLAGSYLITHIFQSVSLCLYMFVHLCVCVCVCVCISPVCPYVYSGELFRSRHSPKFNSPEQNWVRELHVWHRCVLRLQPGILPVRITCAHLSTHRPMGQALTWVHRWVQYVVNVHRWSVQVKRLSSVFAIYLVFGTIGQSTIFYLTKSEKSL